MTDGTATKDGDHPPHSHSSSNQEYNVFRDSLLRYAGYANEVGESFRYQYPRWVTPSYAVAIGYGCADAAVTGWKAYADAQSPETNANPSSSVSPVQTAALAFLDTLVWQSLASVMIPGVTIHAIVTVTTRAMVPRLPRGPVATWLPTVAGLGSIPFMVQPIDEAVEYGLDRTWRPLWHA